MVLDSLIVTLSALVGWIAGITAHVIRRSSWDDLGARVGWFALGASIAAPAVGMAVGATLLFRSLVWLLLDAIAAGLAGGLGWWATERTAQDARTGPPLSLSDASAPTQELPARPPAIHTPEQAPAPAAKANVAPDVP